MQAQGSGWEDAKQSADVSQASYRAELQALQADNARKTQVLEETDAKLKEITSANEFLRQTIHRKDVEAARNAQSTELGDANAVNILETKLAEQEIALTTYKVNPPPEDW